MNGQAIHSAALCTHRLDPAAQLLRDRALTTQPVAYLLIGPAIFLMALLLAAPLTCVFVLAFTDYQLGDRTLSFIGFTNFQDLAHDPVFGRALSNTALYVLIVVPNSVALGLVAALLIQSAAGLKTFYRAMFFLPVMSTVIATAIVWEFMLHPTFGFVNVALKATGFSPHNWLQDGDFALYALSVFGIWQQFGLNMVLFLAGLASIPRYLYEAAAVDGAASGWERFRLVTWPMLGPVTLFVVVITSIRSFQVFDVVHALTRGGPNKATEVLLYSMYAEGFEFFRTGRAAAIAIVFIGIVLVLTLVKARILEKRVHY